MTARIHAVFASGVFRPTESVGIANGTAVEITVSTENSPQTPADSFTALSAIAGLPFEGPDDGFSSADHDDVLYPKTERDRDFRRYRPLVRQRGAQQPETLRRFGNGMAAIASHF